MVSGHPRRAELGQAEHTPSFAHPHPEGGRGAGQDKSLHHHPPPQGPWECPPSFRSLVAGSLLLTGEQEGLQKGWEGSGFQTWKSRCGTGPLLEAGRSAARPGVSQRPATGSEALRGRLRAPWGGRGRPGRCGDTSAVKETELPQGQLPGGPQTHRFLEYLGQKAGLRGILMPGGSRPKPGFEERTVLSWEFAFTEWRFVQ